MFSFVILHYKSINETINCLKYLKKNFDQDSISIIVIDNNSLEENQLVKIREYTEDIIILNENRGFAKANNIGCKYAIDKYHPDFIAVINNDVFIEQRDFINIINEDYKKYKFDMLGPWINSTTGESCNPFPVFQTKEKVEAALTYNKKLIKIYNNPILYWLSTVYIKIKHTIKRPVVPINGKNIEKKIALHGCAIIFSKKYYKRYDDIFYNDTFLFYEEEFLYNRIIKDQLISVYDPNLKVFHKEGASITKDRNLRKSKLFKTKEKIKSLELLLKEL